MADSPQLRVISCISGVNRGGGRGGGMGMGRRGEGRVERKYLIVQPCYSHSCSL